MVRSCLHLHGVHMYSVTEEENIKQESQSHEECPHTEEENITEETQPHECPRRTPISSKTQDCHS